MADPISLVALGAVVGGAAGKLTEKAWDSGEKMLATIFGSGQEAAKKKAQENNQKFLRCLAQRVSDLEKTGGSGSKIEISQEAPDFHMTLQKAMVTATQTCDENKHDLLARIVAERINSESDSLLSLTSKMACDVISYATSNQLNILGYATELYFINSTEDCSSQAIKENWLSHRMKAFGEVKFSQFDFLHLQSLGCMNYLAISKNNLSEILRGKFPSGFDSEAFLAGESGKGIKEIWDQKKLGSAVPLTVGQIIGVMVSDLKTGTKTGLTNWGTQG